ncbi:MAG: FtsW/RodA/SpoVE family cell cycle protein [Clostridia bacterium]|nr:FtsW/RodA/SpoVE family cell cycle protein [Clostridia bacterium]
MKEFSIPLKEKIRRIDPIVLLCVISMNVMSIVTLLSEVDAFAEGVGMWYVRMQTIVSVAGLLAVLVFAFIDYDALFQKTKYLLIPLSIVIILIVKRFGHGENGNDNWITIPGIGNIQPTEFVKLLMIVAFAMHLDRLKDKLNEPLSVLRLGIHAGLYVGLIVWQGDTGMALVYLGILIVMVFGAGVSYWYFAGGGVAAVLAFPTLWNGYLSNVQKKRIIAGFNPDIDPLDRGWQAIASRSAIIAGGFRGAGFNGGTKYYTLHWAAQSDFIFSVLAEKFGFLGTFLYLALVVTLILRIFWIARGTRKNYASYICIGVAGMILVQAAENIGMCLAILPVVGITCPFLSYGPSSLFSMYLAIAMVESICTHQQKYYFEREPE